MTAATTYDERKHPRAKGGQFKDKATAWSPRHAGGLSREARIRTAAGGMAASGFWALGQGAFLIGAVLSVAGSSVLAWGGYKGYRKRRARRGTSHRLGFPWFGSLRFTSESQVQAYITFREWKKAQRRERYIKAGRAVQAVRAKVKTP